MIAIAVASVIMQYVVLAFSYILHGCEYNSDGRDQWQYWMMNFGCG